MAEIDRRSAGGTALAVFACLTMVSGPLRAATCLEKVEALAARYELEILAPPLSAPALRGRSGVIAPGPGTDPETVIPPPGSGDAMPTIPEIAPGTPTGRHTGPGGLDAGERLRLAAVLTAARGAALSGDPAACRDRLDAAARLVERSSQRPEDAPRRLSPG